MALRSSTGVLDKDPSTWYAADVLAPKKEESLPTLLRSAWRQSKGSYRGKRSSRQNSAVEIATVSAESYLPDFGKKLGSGAYGQVYPVVGMPDKVVKIFRRKDWQELTKESTFARSMKARYPANYVDCLGIGSSASPEGGPAHYFAVFERAPGITLEDAAYQFHHPLGIRNVAQALDVLDQLLAIITDMMIPDDASLLQIHLDLKPQNVMISIDPAGPLQVTLVDYGLVEVCSEGAEADSAALQLFRWVGYEFLWLLASEAFHLNGRDDQSPWEQLPEGFRPFFRRSDFRPLAYQTDKLSRQILQDALQDDFFELVLSPLFRQQWSSPERARVQIGTLLGELFYGVARASDRFPLTSEFAECRRQIQALRGLVAVD